MINSNKILTVSYGTFSCTLEGFDDSFGTMKAIAEYFRDLSADDRYFGAEPVQPDAQMLARIAQREISRQVDAREDEGRIVLSARDAAEEAKVTHEPTPATQPEAPADQEDTVTHVEELTQTAVEDFASPAEEAAELEDAIAELDASEEVSDETVEPADEVEDVAEQSVEEIEEAPAQTEDAVAQALDADEHDIVPSLPDADVEAFFADRETSADVEEDMADDMPEAVDEPAQERAKADSIAEKLKRIRAVVSQQPETTATPNYSEDQHAEANTPAAAAMATIADADTQDTDEGADMLSDTLRDIEGALDEDDTYEVEAAEADLAAEEEDSDDDISAILSRLEDEDLAYGNDGADFDDGLDGNLDFDDDIEEGDDTAENILAAMEDEPETDEDDNMFEPQEEAAEQIDLPSDEPEQAKPAAPRARVLKVKRATLEAAIHSGKLEEYDDEAEEEAALRKAPLSRTSSLSDEAEEELARELAELEADMKAEKEEANAAVEAFEDEFEAEAEAEAEAIEEAKSADAPRATLDANADESFSRLMEETENQMEEPESSTRRDAFAHLRAAVAAKKADEAIGGADDEKDSDEPYRDDLASVVRPRRPTGSDRPRTERPAEQRPAPLKLVAEQRIDNAEPRRVTPVRPRRVSAAQVAPAPEANADASEEGSFADFAAEMGAVQLPDLLEAAAAYLSFVEGREEFSRPQLMTKVRQVEKESFTREDGLRSFGKLLREGKIHKLSGGRFQASDQIGFKPDARAAG